MVLLIHFQGAYFMPGFRVPESQPFLVCFSIKDAPNREFAVRSKGALIERIALLFEGDRAESLSVRHIADEQAGRGVPHTLRRGRG